MRADAVGERRREKRRRQRSERLEFSDEARGASWLEGESKEVQSCKVIALISIVIMRATFEQYRAKRALSSHTESPLRRTSHFALLCKSKRDQKHCRITSKA